MNIAIIILVSFLTALLFDVLPLIKSFKQMIDLQREAFIVIKDPKLSDDQKQILLFTFIGKIMSSTIKLILLILIAMLPFAAIIGIEHLIFEKNIIAELIISIKGILITSVTFVIYYFFKKVYGKFRV